MKKSPMVFWFSITVLTSVLTCITASAQPADETSKIIDALNRTIDRAVVMRNILVLQKHYGDDFVFTHGTGKVDSKESWLKSIQNITDENPYLSREHDSTQVELHRDVAIVTGKLTVVRKTKPDTRRYSLRYVRVYALRNKVWQMICHRTTHEWHL